MLFGSVAVAALAIAFATPNEAAAQAEEAGQAVARDRRGSLGNDNHMVAWIMKNYINEYSDTLDARIYAANALGEERAVVEGMQLGAGATCHIGGSAIYNNFVRRMGVLDLPFMWKGYDHAHAVLDGPVGQALAKEYEGRGSRCSAGRIAGAIATS